MLISLLLIQSLSSPTSEALDKVWAAVSHVDARTGKVLIRSGAVQLSWSTSRPAASYGASVSEEESRYLYRIPPDWSRSRHSQNAVVVESYLDGFPVLARRANGGELLARPLGFEYDEDGVCRNARVELKIGDKWVMPKLSDKAKTRLVAKLALFENRSNTEKSPSLVADPRKLWFRVTAEGYGAYLFYKDLLVVSPKGVRERLFFFPETRDDFSDILAGNQNKEPGERRSAP